MDPIPEILDELKRGRMIVLVDDEQRENEGDLVCAAEFVTPEVVNFMLRIGRGMLCVALAGELTAQLGLDPQATVNTAPRGTAYTVSVDAQPHHGVSTGVSAGDRATTIRLLAGSESTAADFCRPGHIQPLRARDGGVLVRAGQTEGSVDLCRLAGLRPAAGIIEVLNEDGSMARRPELETLCREHGLKMCSVADVIQYRLQRDQLVNRIESVPVETEAGPFQLIAYESEVDLLPHVALTLGRVGQLDQAGQPVVIEQPVLVRMHSQNLLGDVFSDRNWPTGQTLQSAMRMIQKAGEGAIVYLRHEQMGTGVLRRLQTARREASAGSSISEESPPIAFGQSQAEPGIRPPADKRDYGIGSQILRDLGVRRMRLITRHPFTPTALAGFGLSIDGFVDPETGQLREGP